MTSSTSLTEQQASHLSRRPVGSKLIAWHSRVNAQAVKLFDGSEALFIDGKRIQLGPEALPPTQIIINLAHCKAGELRKALEHLKA